MLSWLYFSSLAFFFIAILSVAWGRSPADLGWPEVANGGGGGGWFGQGLWQQPPAAAASTTMTTYGSAANYPPGPGSGLSRESSRDDLTSMELDQVFDYEERFRVDRRKLELLILGRFEPIKETACDYFQRIGDETNTTVIWPSRLKVGAKSKKGTYDDNDSTPRPPLI